MADRLTQLQDSIDEYLVQCYAGLAYTFYHHPYAEIPNQPNQAPPTVSADEPDPGAALTNGSATNTQSLSQQAIDKAKDAPDNKDDAPPEQRVPSDKPHSAADHTASLRELAQGLVLKEQQIEYLIQSLPGIGSSERDQERRIRELQEELRVVERERAEKERMREGLVEGLGNWIVGGRRVP